MMARTSRNTVKKYIHIWSSLKMSYEEFHKKSDAELHELFCVPEDLSHSNPLTEKYELIEIPEETVDIPDHENIRGKEYYE